MTYLLLFLEFFKIGLFAIGGGLAALPFLYELAPKYNWFTEADITNMIAISESTPGPIAVNMATYVGYHTAGVMGGIIATLGNILPAIIIVLIVAKYLEKFKDNSLVQAGFYGIRPAVAALITVALFAVVKVSILRWDVFVATENWGALVDWRAAALFAVALALILKMEKHPVFYIAAGALAGILIAPR